MSGRPSREVRLGGEPSVLHVAGDGPAAGTVDVIVVSYRNAATIAAAVTSARSCDAVARVVVVDNHPGDGGGDRAAAAGADEVLPAPGNLGFAAGVNFGLPACRAPFVLLLNPDATIAGDCLSQLLQALRDNDTAVVAAPLQRQPDGTLSLGAYRFSTWLNRTASLSPLVHRWASLGAVTGGVAAARRAPAPLPVDYVFGAALLVRCSFLDEIGGLDERFFLYHEDEDLCRQAWARGRSVLLVPGAVVGHTGEVSSRGDHALAEARIAFATWQVLDKWEGPYAATLFRGLSQAAYLLRWWSAVIRSRTSRAGEACLTWRALRAMYRAGSVRGAAG